MTPKNPKKRCFFYRDGFLYNNKRAYFKKGPRERVALNMSLQTKKIYDFILNSGRMAVALRRRTYLLRKTRNNFSKRFFVVLSFF